MIMNIIIIIIIGFASAVVDNVPLVAATQGIQGFQGFGLSICVECVVLLLLVVWHFFETRDVETVPSNSIIGIPEACTT